MQFVVLGESKVPNSYSSADIFSDKLFFQRQLTNQD